jgi:hypothetical protein
MGYHTDFQLSVDHYWPYAESKIDAAIDEMNRYFERSSDGTFWLDLDDTWYDHEEDMVKLSAKFPEILFELEGTGEQAMDLWVKYFKGGKIQRAPAQITFPDFDEKLLENLS